MPYPVFLGGIAVLIKVAIPAAAFLLSAVVGRDWRALLAGLALLTVGPACGAFGGLIYHLANGGRPAAGARHYGASILAVLAYLGSALGCAVLVESRWPSQEGDGSIISLLQDPAGQFIFVAVGIFFGIVVGYQTRTPPDAADPAAA